MRVVKRSARTKDGETWRVAIVPIRLSGADYRRAHEACHKAASLWNFFLASIQEYWKENETDPTEKEMRHFLYEQRPDLRDGLHAHTVQLILGDLMDAVSTYRSNRDSGDKKRQSATSGEELSTSGVHRWLWLAGDAGWAAHRFEFRQRPQAHRTSPPRDRGPQDRRDSSV